MIENVILNSGKNGIKSGANNKSMALLKENHMKVLKKGTSKRKLTL